MKAAFRKDGWTTVVTSRDLEFDSEQKEVGMAVDMDLARKAAVFIGNGVCDFSFFSDFFSDVFGLQWSSFTSNIVHRRLVDEKEHISNRFF